MKQTYNIYMTKHSHFPYTSTYSLTIPTENTTSITSHTQTNNILQHPKYKKYIFNNSRYTTHISTYPHTVTTTDIKQTCVIYIHLLSLGIKPKEAKTKYCVHLHHPLAALKRDFLASLVAPLHKVNAKTHP